MARTPRVAVAACLLLATVVPALPCAPARPPEPAGPCFPGQVERLNAGLAGRILDYTHNHGADRRIWSPALCARRNVYVYLPPGYDGTTPLPAALWLHGLAQDERGFFEVLPLFDAAIRGGKLPPMILAAPDGSIPGVGVPTLIRNGSFYVNSAAGRYGDYVVHDVWHGLVRARFAVRPDRGSHVLAGASMGGFGAYHLGFKHKAEFGVLVGAFPPLDLTYADCHGKYLAEFDPLCRGVRTEFPRGEVIGRFTRGLINVHSRRLTDPLIGRRADPVAVAAFIHAVNPADLLASADVRPGEFALWAGYGTKDEFNAGSQVQSFAERCRARGVAIDLAVVPGGGHNRATARALFPAASDWLRTKLAADTTTAPLP